MYQMDKRREIIDMPVYLMEEKRSIAILILIFIAISFLSQLIASTPILAHTMTINNITGANHDNATGSIMVENIGDTTNPSTLLAKAISHLPDNTTSIKSAMNQTPWWQYNSGSRLAP